MDEIKDKYGNAIHQGDHVYTKIRGGRHEGEVTYPNQPHYEQKKQHALTLLSQVEKIVKNQAEAEEEDVKNPPKVRYRLSSRATICTNVSLTTPGPIPWPAREKGSS